MSRELNVPGGLTVVALVVAQVKVEQTATDLLTFRPQLQTYIKTITANP
jgi:hypothetical protein